MRGLALPLLAALALAAGGCGATSAGGDIDDATLLLDGQPGAVHSGIYTTLARDYDSSEGVRLRVRVPGARADAAGLLARGRVTFAILPLADLVEARAAGAELVGIAALVQRPLDPAPREPVHPELIVTTAQTTLDEQPELPDGLVVALRRGYAEVLADPESAVEVLQRRVRGLRRGPLLDDLRVVAPAFTAGGRFGTLDRGRLEAWARWARRAGVTGAAPDLDRAFAFEVAAGG